MNDSDFTAEELLEGVSTSLNCLQFVAFVARQADMPLIERDAHALHDAMLLQFSCGIPSAEHLKVPRTKRQ